MAILDCQGQPLVVFSVIRISPASLPQLIKCSTLCTSECHPPHNQYPPLDRLSNCKVQPNFLGSVGTLPAVCDHDTFCLRIDPAVRRWIFPLFFYFLTLLHFVCLFFSDTHDQRSNDGTRECPLHWIQKIIRNRSWLSVKSLRDKDLKNKCSNCRHSRSIIYGHT